MHQMSPVYICRPLSLTKWNIFIKKKQSKIAAFNHISPGVHCVAWVILT